MPTKHLPVRFKFVSADKHALGGKAIREQFVAHFSSRIGGPSLDVLYLPAGEAKPVPVLVGLNF